MRYEAKDQVFVAMPFTASFEEAYEGIIDPAIRRVTVNGRKLEPCIINRATSGSPDIHEQIFEAILHSRLVIADLTVQSSHEASDGGVRWQPNSNVAYEVGLAAAWRNPEDILLIHQDRPGHSYSFDVQNLRHVPYDSGDPSSVKSLSDEIVRALNQSTFLGTMAFQKILESVSPCALQFMHVEARRAFPGISFKKSDVGGLVGARIQAATDLISYGALKNRHVVPQGSGKGVAVIYQWTELGLRMLLALRAVTQERLKELRSQIESVPSEQLPPPELLEFPDTGKAGEPAIDMTQATQVDETNEALETTDGESA